MLRDVLYLLLIEANRYGLSEHTLEATATLVVSMYGEPGRKIFMRCVHQEGEKHYLLDGHSSREVLSRIENRYSGE